MADELKTGGADAGAGASQTAGSVSGDAGQAGTTTVTSVDQVPEHIRQQIFDTGYGKGMQKAETQFMDQYGDHIQIANWVGGREQMPDDIAKAMLQMPGMVGRYQLIEQPAPTADGVTEDPRINQLATQVQQLQQGVQQNQQKVWIDQMNAKLDTLSGGNAIKKSLMRERMLSNFKDGNTPTFSMDDMDKWSGEIDGTLKESGHATKSEYVQGKMDAKDKGAEGSAGTPPSPGEPEDVGAFGVFDDDMSQAVQAGLEAVEE